ncbi:669_t:CDS:2, partial [Funneliformis caledonium]
MNIHRSFWTKESSKKSDSTSNQGSDSNQEEIEVVSEVLQITILLEDKSRKKHVKTYSKQSKQ